MKTLSLYLILFLLSLQSYSQNVAEINKEGLLWRISGNKLSSSSFLLGTNHAMHYYYLDSIPRAWEAFNSVNQIISEILLEGSTIYDESLNKEIIDFEILKTNRKRRNKTIFFNYKECLNENDFKYLQSIYHSFSGKDNLESTKLIPLDMFDWFNQAFYLNFEQKFNREQEKFRHKTFFLRNYINTTEPIWMDRYLQQKAVHRNYSIIGLETLADRELLNKEQAIETVKIKTELNTDTSACTLAKNIIEYLKIKEKDSFEPDIVKLHKLYTSENFKFFGQRKKDEIIYDTLSLYDSVSRNKLSILYDKYSIKLRNLNWMKQLPEIITNRPSFIAVGMNHLAGEYGIINLLREEGYTVEPVTQSIEITSAHSSLAKGIKDIRKDNIEHEFSILKETPYSKEWLGKFKILVLYAYSWFGELYLDRINELKYKIIDEDIVSNQDFFDFYLRPHFMRGDTITDLSLNDVNEDKKLLLNIIMPDKYTMLCFWKATDWCMDQLLEIPESTKPYKDKLNIIYINIDNDIQKWEEASKQLNLGEYNFIIDTEDSATFSRYLESTIINKKTANFYYLVSPDNHILNIQSFFFQNYILSLYIRP